MATVNQKTAEVPVVSSEARAERRELWYMSKRLDIPYIVVLKDGKTGCFLYDMFTVDRDLKEEAVEKIMRIFETYLQNNKDALGAKTFYWGAGPINGFFPGLELSKAIELGGEIASVVRDPKNHIPLKGGLP